MMAALVIVSAVGVSTGLFALWVRIMNRVDEREQNRMAEELRKGRW